MDEKDAIKQILRENVGKDTINRICIMDFDGTLIDTPTHERGHKEYEAKTGKVWPHKGWWGRPESLDMDVFDMKPIPSVIAAYKKEKATPNTLVIMLTGRIPKLSGEVKKILDSKGLTFDKYIYNMGGSTLDSKIASLNKLLAEYPNVKSVILYDDRDEHIGPFKEWGAAQDGLDFHITHVEGNHHGPQ
jgi:hypothetical protein